MQYFVALIFMIFLGSSLANATSLVPDACMKLSKNDPNDVNYDFCVKSLGSDPRSLTASLKELGGISIELDLSKLDSLCSKIITLIRDPRFDPFVKSRLGDCYDMYSNARNYLQDGLGYWQGGDYHGANVMITGVMTSATTCEDAFKDKQGELSPLTRRIFIFTDWLQSL